MPFKDTSTKLFAAILASVMGAAMLYAQDSTSTNENETNTVSAPAESPAVNTNTVSNTKFGSNSIPVSKAQHNSGLHASGGQNCGYAVDINPRNGMAGKTVIALAAIVCPFLVVFGLPVAVIVIVFYFRHRQNKLMHETIRAMVDRGVPVTPEMIAGLNPSLKANVQGKLAVQRFRNRYLLAGLILSGAGLALIIGLPEHSGPGGLIILFIGLAFLIVWLVERKQNANDQRKQENDQQPPKT